MADKEIRIEADTGSSTSDVNELRLELLGLREESKKLNTNLGENSKSLQAVSDSIKKMAAATEGSTQTYREAGNQIIGLNNQFGQLRNTVAGFIAMVGAGVGVQQMVEDFRAGEDAARRLEQVLKTTGYAASMSQEDIAKFADDLEKRTGRSATEIQTVAAQLATFTSIGRAEFLKTIVVADDLAATFGGDLQGNLDAVARALDDPIKGFGNLQKRGFALTDQELKRVKAHLAAGESAKAQGIILDNLAKQVNGAAEASNQGLTKALNDLKKQAGDTFKALAESGGLDAAVAALQALTASAKALEENIGPLTSAFKALIAAVTAYHVANGVAALSATQLAVNLGKARTAAAALNAVMAANPIGLAALAIGAAVFALVELDRSLTEAARDTAELTRQQKALEVATDAYAIAAGEAAAASGRDAEEKRKQAQKTREAAVASRDLAKAKLQEAKATLAALVAEDMTRIQNDRWNFRGDRPGTLPRNGRQIRAGQADVGELEGLIAAADKRIADADAILASGGSTALDYTPDKDKGGDKAAKEAENRRRIREDMAAAVDLEEAQLLGQTARVQSLEREQAIRERARQLMDAGLEKDRTKAMAESLKLQERIDAAMEKSLAKQEKATVDAWSAELFRIDGREDLVRGYEREALLLERIAKWQELGRDEVSATAMAQSEIAEWNDAQAEATERRMRAAEITKQIAVAELDLDYERVRALEMAEQLEARKLSYISDGLSLKDAEARASADLLALDEARTRAAQRTLDIAQQNHAITIAELQGQDAAARRLRRDQDIKNRSQGFQQNGRMSASEADALARNQVKAEDKAKQKGEQRELFQSAFSEGIKAAMEGDLSGFLQEQFGNIMDFALDKVGGMLFDAVFGTVDAVATGTASATAQAAILGPAIVGASATGAAAMGSAIVAAGATAAAAMAAAIMSANAASKIADIPMMFAKDGGPVLALAGGGGVRGPGGPRTDSVPAMLSDGEFVINAASTKKHRRLIEAINSGKLGGFADGGLVGQITNSAVRGRSVLQSTAGRGDTYGDNVFAPVFNIDGAKGKETADITLRELKRMQMASARKANKEGRR